MAPGGADAALEIDRFFASYSQAFHRFDAADLARHFCYPCHIVAEGDALSLSAIASTAEYVAIITRFLSLYRRVGVRGGAILELATTFLSPRLAFVIIHWRVDGDNAAPLYEFDSAYTLVKPADDWRIAAIAHNEMPRLFALRANLA